MARIAVISSDCHRDWASRELVQAASTLAEGVALDPRSFEISVDGSASIVIQGEPADNYDAFIVRGFNRRGEIDYQFEILELLEQRGKLVINSTAGLSLAESKAQTTYALQESGLPVPRTVVTQDVGTAMDVIREFGTAVIKPLYGSHGVGIELVTRDTEEGLLQDFMDTYGVAYVQEYVPNEGRDIRAFVVGDDIPAAIYRIAREGQWKTNVYQGSHCEPCELTPELRELCIEATRVIGLDYTGVDIMDGPGGPVILELNGAPSWYGLLDATGRNVAIDVVTHIVRLLESGSAARQPEAWKRL